MEENASCQYLDWDSEFFGLRIGRIKVNRLTPETVESVMKWCHSQDIDCLYFLADTEDPNTVRLAENHQFHMLDVRIIFEKRLDVLPEIEKETGEAEIRFSKSEDIPALKAIARASHHDSRFYYDSNFPRSLCDALYETWIEKSCQGWADGVLVADFQGQPVGYLSCHLDRDREGRIGLFAVSAEVQGKGVSENLIYRSLHWFAEQSMNDVSVVTQGRNIKAQRLYQRCGFLTRSIRLWYHRWFPRKG